MLRVVQRLGVPYAPRQISDESVSTIPTQGQGQARMKKGPGTHQVCLKTASAVSTLTPKDACSGLGMAHSSDRERAQGNVEPYLEEIKYSPGPSYVLK